MDNSKHYASNNSNSFYENSEISILNEKHRESTAIVSNFKPSGDHKLSIQTTILEKQNSNSKFVHTDSPAKQLSKSSLEHNNSLSNTEKEIISPSSPLKKMMGAFTKGINNIGKGIGSGLGSLGKGIGSGIGTISKGIGSGIGSIGKGIGTVGKGIGSGIGTIGKGLGLNALGKNLGNLSNALGLNQLGRGLNIVTKGLGLNMLGKGLAGISKQGLRGLNNLSKGLGLDMLGKGLNNLSRLGLDQLGKGLKDISKGLNLRKLQENLKKIAGMNSGLLTQREKKIQFIKGHMKRSDTIAAILALICLVLSYYENDDFYNAVKNPDTGVISKPSNESTPWGNAIRGVVILMSMAMMVNVFLHYHFKLKILKLRRLRLDDDTLYTAGLVPKLAFELFVCAICCPPYFDYTFKGQVLSGTYEYSYDALINVITIMKSYLVLRTYQHYSAWNNERAVQTCKKAKCQASAGFAIKSELKRRPYLMLGVLMLVTIVYLALAIRTFEISYRPIVNNFDFSFFANSMWLIIITMTTVGFGEGYPSTHMGRFIGVCACIIGMLLVSLMVVSLTLSSEFTPEESKAYYILKNIYANDNAKDKAANVIKTLFRLKQVVRSKDQSSFTQRFVWLAKLRKDITIYKNDYRVANSHNLPVDEMLKNLQDKLETDINDIKGELKTVPEMEEKCKDIKVHQIKISENLEEIIKMQSMIGEYLISLNNEKNDE